MRINKKVYKQPASLTVEAALVLPIFIYFIIAFLYFIQIFSLQEIIQKSITTAGLNIAKNYYVLDKYKNREQEQDQYIENALLSLEEGTSIIELTNLMIDSTLIKTYVSTYADLKSIENSCILNGWEGISFTGSKVMDRDDCIDIIVSYHVRIPIHFFRLKDIPMVQRIRLRCWTGTDVTPNYIVDEDGLEDDGDRVEDIKVFITETGTVYHLTRDCSHINIRITEVNGVPTDHRNDHGAKYYPCERCGISDDSIQEVYYITADGNRYHSSIRCSGLKRTVLERYMSEVPERRPCSRCAK